MVKKARRRGESAQPTEGEARLAACVAIASPINGQNSLRALFSNLPVDTGACFVISFRTDRTSQRTF